MPRKLPSVITGTLYLSAAGVITRFMGFLYKIWLGNLIGPEELGIYQLVFPAFAICLSICGAPFQTAVSKFTAEYQEHHPKKAGCYLKLSLFLSLTLAFLCAGFLMLFREQVAAYFLLNNRCTRLLPYIAFSIPLSAVHNCVTGWYYGQKKTVIPAAANLIEQGTRILFVFFLLHTSLEFTVIQVVWALAVGELTSALVTSVSCFFCSHKQKSVNSHHAPISQRKILLEILFLIWPLIANRLVMSVLQSVESIMIPSRLILYGYSESTALSMYGALTGMALSFIMFPTAFTGSFSLMLLPDIARACAENRTSYIQKASRLSLGTTFLMGCIFSTVFFLLGEPLGELCFPGTLAGTYIRSLSWLCPFLYLNNVLTSILHGMGMTALTFKTQLSGLILRLGVTVFLIPLYGMKCYFLALLGSQLLMSILNLRYLYNSPSIR